MTNVLLPPRQLEQAHQKLYNVQPCFLTGITTVCVVCLLVCVSKCLCPFVWVNTLIVIYAQKMPVSLSFTLCPAKFVLSVCPTVLHSFLPLCASLRSAASHCFRCSLPSDCVRVCFCGLVMSWQEIGC